MMKLMRQTRRTPNSPLRRLLLPIAALSVFALLLAACGDADDDDDDVDVTAEDDTETDDDAEDDDAATDEEWPEELTFMTGSTGGSWQALGAALGAVIEREMDGLRVDVLPGASQANLIGIQQGDANIALSNAFATVEGFQGEGEFEGDPITDVVHLAALNTQMFQMWVQDDADIQTIEDLPGHSLVTLGQGSAGEAGVADVLDVHGISYDDLSRVEFGSSGDMVDFISDRQVDVAANVAPLPASYYLEMAASQDIRMIGVAEDMLEELSNRNPGYLPDVIPAGTYDGEDEDVNSFSTAVHLVVARDLPNDFIYELTQVLADNADEIRAVAEAFEEVTAEGMGRDLGLEMHPGAEEYFADQG